MHRLTMLKWCVAKPPPPPTCFATYKGSLKTHHHHPFSGCLDFIASQCKQSPRLPPRPSRLAACVAQHHALRGEFIANAVGFCPIFIGAGKVALGNQGFNRVC